MAVDDPAAARRHECQIDAVAFRFEHIAIIVDDRNIGNARRQRGADRRLRPADDERAAGEGYAPPGFGERRALDRKSVGAGKRVYVSVGLGGRRVIKKKKKVATAYIRETS